VGLDASVLIAHFCENQGAIESVDKFELINAKK